MEGKEIIYKKYFLRDYFVLYLKKFRLIFFEVIGPKEEIQEIHRKR